jgi:hypothetical protein
MSKYRFGCGDKIVVAVPRGYDYREITVECGSTSIYGTPWQCEKCEKKFSRVNYRREAALDGEEF